MKRFFTLLMLLVSASLFPQNFNMKLAGDLKPRNIGPSGMTSTEQRLIEYAERDLKNALAETNAFFANDWKAYQQEMEGLDLSPFKETEMFLLEK